jgi:hypothetical protein
LDTRLRLVPIGVAGEIYIGGDSLARGYLNRPGLTAEKFVPDPFDNSRGGRLYQTGDLARYRPDGFIEFLGRRDHQVKVRGYRIELGEIEAVLCEHPAVRESVVIAREEAGGLKRLVAYLVRNGEPAVTATAIQVFLKDRLPDHMIPSALVFLEALPITPNGKVDRRALPEPDQPRAELAQDFAAPRTEVEQVIAEIWKAVLGVNQPGVHDNFFKSGGHSLLATRIISRVRDTLEMEIPVRTVFEYPTIAEFSDFIEDRLLEDFEAMSEATAAEFAERMADKPQA